MKKLTLALLFLSIFSIGNAQEIFYIRRNVIRADLSMAPPAVLAFSFNYEHLLLQRNWFGLHAAAGFGQYFENTGGPHSSFPGFASGTASLISLFGKHSHRFELEYGARYNFVTTLWKDEFHPWRPQFNLGYRYQHPEGKGFVFRAYAGLAGIGASLGKAF